MNQRRGIQIAHERAQVAGFIDWMNERYGSRFEVIEEPNPPEAVIRSGRTVRWVEVTDAYWNDQFARDEYSYATPGEVHQSINGIVFSEPDAQFTERFIGVIKQKLEKKSYRSVFNKYGAGYLLVPVMYPLYSGETEKMMREAWSKTQIGDLGCFRSVYMSMTMGRGPIRRWIYRGRS